MLTSELIQRLQGRLKEYGDLPCVIIAKDRDGEKLLAVAMQTAHARIPMMGPIGECLVILADIKSGAETLFA
jgi:hypothetical protein